MRVLGIIPARGGSKGVPGKNIKLLEGKPLIAYTIEAARESTLLSDFIVASDSDEILKIAELNNCKSFKRNKNNAADDSLVTDVILQVINEVEIEYDIIVLLQPTAPIRKGRDIDNVIKMFENERELTSVVSVVELKDIHPARMYELNESLEMKPLNSIDEAKRRQDLNPVYLRNGSLYAVRTDYFRKTGKLIGDNKKAYIMPESHWVNVDTPRDFLIAELLIKLWKNGELLG